MSSLDQSSQTPYALLGGDQAIRDLCNAFYDAMDSLPEASHIRAMHNKNLVDIKQKLYEYLSGWMGGPNLYSERYNTICLTEPHAPYSIGSKERDQWMKCMEKALDTIETTKETKQLLMPAFANLADFIRNKSD